MKKDNLFWSGYPNQKKLVFMLLENKVFIDPNRALQALEFLFCRRLRKIFIFILILLRNTINLEKKMEFP